MAKKKMSAQVAVADGAGNLVPVPDQRFEAGIWPIKLEVPKHQAGQWLQYLSAECANRAWHHRAMSQMESVENSGSITVSTGPSAPCPELVIVWERRRGGPLKVKAKPSGSPALALEQAKSFIELVNEQCREGKRQRFYRRGQLEYDGRAWRGELWLANELRLGPPSQHWESAERGPRVIVVDALFDCICPTDSPFAFDLKLRELAAFLSVVMAREVRLPPTGWVWTYMTGTADCTVRARGYFETNIPQKMPTRGSCKAVALRPVSRPDLSRDGFHENNNEESLPADVAVLWAAFSALPTERRQQFLQSAAKWQQAISHWREERTLSMALMVVACEALKPPQKQYNDNNVYDAVEALLGRSVADSLQEPWLHPQGTRNAHFHRGECKGGEFAQRVMLSSFEDPSFDEGCRALFKVTQAAIIEWLRRGGVMQLSPRGGRRGRKSWKARVWRAISVLGVLSVGIILGWLLRRLLGG